MNLKRLVEETDTLAGRCFALGIQFLIVVSIITFSIETLPDLSPRTRVILAGIEVATVAIFTVEYVLRLWVADRPLRFLFSFYGLIDLAAIAPFYLGRIVDLRAIRIARLMRLFRIFKLARYSKGLDRIRNAFFKVREALVVHLAATTFVVYFASVGIYYFERDAQPEAFASVFHSMWWAIATLTTVGYGDVYPVTVGGRIFTGLMLLIGLGMISVPSALLAAAMVEQDAEDEE